jgi:hypothetical protein
VIRCDVLPLARKYKYDDNEDFEFPPRPAVLLLLIEQLPFLSFHIKIISNMTQIAAAWSTDHALNIHEDSAATLNVHSSPAKATDRTYANHAESTLYQGRFYRATSQLKYSDRLKVSFSVNETTRQHFILIKGLLEFHRNPGVVFTFNKAEGTFEATTGALQENELNGYLRKISAWIEQELSFRKRLKDMLSFEREYRAKLATVYSGVEGFTLFPTL